MNLFFKNKYKLLILQLTYIFSRDMFILKNQLMRTVSNIYYQNQYLQQLYNVYLFSSEKDNYLWFISHVLFFCNSLTDALQVYF